MGIITKGNKGGYLVAKYTANGFFNVETSNVVGETVNTMSFTNILWSSNNSGVWNISRGANVVATLSGSGQWDLAEIGMALETGGENAANVVVTLEGSTGTLIMKLHKQSSFTTEY